MTTPHPFPRQSDADDELPWARSRRTGEDRTTARMRKIVEGLPEWEPLPPGEITVRRGGSV